MHISSKLRFGFICSQCWLSGSPCICLYPVLAHRVTLYMPVSNVGSQGHLAHGCIQCWLSGPPCICLCSQSPFPLAAQYHGDRNCLHGVWKSSEADCYNSKIIFKNKRFWDSVLASPFLRQIPVVFLSEHKETMELVKYLWSNFFFFCFVVWIPWEEFWLFIIAHFQQVTWLFLLFYNCLTSIILKNNTKFRVREILFLWTWSSSMVCVTHSICFTHSYSRKTLYPFLCLWSVVMHASEI